MKNLYNQFATWLLNLIDSSSSIILGMTIVGIITSSLAQQRVIKKNKSLPDKTKSFLIKQEMMDFLLSIGFLCTLGIGSKKLIKNLTSKGYLLNDRVMKGIESVAKSHGITPQEIIKSGFLETAPEKLQQINITQFGRLNKNFEKCQEGLNVIGTIATSILTTNLLVPICRNALTKQPPSKNTKPIYQQTVNIPYNLPIGKISPANLNSMSTTLKI